MSLPISSSPNITDAQLEALTESVQVTFEAILGSAPQMVEGEPWEHTVSGVVGMISLVGDIGWSVMLVLPPESATSLGQAFTGFELEYDSEDMGDVVGELVNVLAGDLLARLEQVGARAQMGLPAVLRGETIRMMLPDQEPLLRLAFEAPQGRFGIVVGARPTS